MAENKIDLEIVTPKGKALSASVDEVTAPSVEGEFGVLPGHLPVIAALRTGLVTYRQGNESKTCAIGPGFAEAGHDKLLILAEDYADKQGLDPVVVRKELKEVETKLEKLLAADQTSEIEHESKELIARENWLAALLELHGDPPPATMRPFEQWGPPPSALTEEEEGFDADHGAS